MLLFWSFRRFLFTICGKFVAISIYELTYHSWWWDSCRDDFLNLHFSFYLIFLDEQMSLQWTLISSCSLCPLPFHSIHYAPRVGVDIKLLKQPPRSQPHLFNSHTVLRLYKSIMIDNRIFSFTLQNFNITHRVVGIVPLG